MKPFRFVALFFVLLLTVAWMSPAHADQFTDTIAIYKKSPTVQPFFKNSYGYAVFPTVGKAGFVVGGAYGNGQVYVKGKITGTAELVKASIGFQAGAQAFSQMIFFQDKRAYEEFTSGNFEFEAGVSAVAITAGVQAKAGTEGATAGASAGPATGAQAETSYHKGMAVFVHTIGGLMYEASVGGQSFSFEPKK
jgi:lipid-binding SYLF domain-containing protein